MIWRAFHGFALFYVLILVILVILPPNIGISAVHDIFPDIGGGSLKVFASQAVKAPAHLHPAECGINFVNIARQLKSIWFTAHVLGWWGKMCLLRDWQMCMIYSISFEVVELSLVWLIPEFEECFWDSIFMDVLGANMIGMYLGHLTLQYLACRKYDWEPENDNGPIWHHIKHLARKFTPFSWSNYEWPKDSKSWWLSSACWFGALVMEFNSFLLIHGLIIRPSHWFNTARLITLGAIGLSAVPEFYEYVRGQTERIGHNSWIMFTIIALELLLGYRYGKGGRSYGQLSPPRDIVNCWVSFLVLWTLWFAISTYRGMLGIRRSPNWLLCLRMVSYTPLLFLTRRWVF